MSIRLRFTLLYNAILALTLAVFGITLYSIQAQTTYAALKNDLTRSSERMGEVLLRIPVDAVFLNDAFQAQPPRPFQSFSDEQAIKTLPEREIVRVLDAAGNLVVSPFGSVEDSLPLSAAGLAALSDQQEWWETGWYQEQRMLIYSRPVSQAGELGYIVQVARPLTERDRSLQALGATLVAASLVLLLAAFGIGWLFSGLTLQPIQRLTQAAQDIGERRDFSHRVAYTGPPDEVGQLATTFNAMLARLQDAYQQVARALELQRNFVADVSHELRTPLTTLRGNVGLLQRQPPLPAAEQADILNDLVDESDRLVRLVNELLVLARADAGRRFGREAVPIRPLFDELLRQAQQLEPGRKLTLQVADLAILGDRDAFKQVLLVALDNALKHSTGPIEMQARLVESFVEIRVQDNGPGIPPDKLALVFDRFYRGEAAAGTPGFGLGLAIAKSLVEGMGGAIWMESEVGKGSVLSIRFPLAG